jgi:hypothetical protein
MSYAFTGTLKPEGNILPVKCPTNESIWRENQLKENSNA